MGVSAGAGGIPNGCTRLGLRSGFTGPGEFLALGAGNTSFGVTFGSDTNVHMVADATTAGAWNVRTFADRGFRIGMNSMSLIRDRSIFRFSLASGSRCSFNAGGPVFTTMAIGVVSVDTPVDSTGSWPVGAIVGGVNAMGSGPMGVTGNTTLDTNFASFSFPGDHIADVDVADNGGMPTVG